MTGTSILRFSLGPVQGFVGQARRTRDLWAGSFLLSWLTAHAMVAVRKGNGTIVFPVVDEDDLVRALERHPSNPQPEIGTVPNQFKAVVPEDFNLTRCSDAIFDAWTKLCGAVWQTFVEPIENLGQDTKFIWDRQCMQFWEIYWVFGKDPGDGAEGSWPEVRKNWRTHVPPVEQGDHCTLMGDLQEISGYVRARGQGKEQEHFWDKMRTQKAGSMDGLDLRERERLCAVALVKRLFPRLPEVRLRESIGGWIPGGDIDSIGRWPSTGHVAAAHWIEAAEGSVPDACRGYADYVESNLHRKHRGERFTRIRCLTSTTFSRLREIDANLLHPDDVANEYALKIYNRNDKEDDGGNGNGNLRTGLLKALKDFIDATKMGEPTPYFALLLMDGDRVGKLLAELQSVSPGTESKVSTALADFTKEVKKSVLEHNGVLIYAGGDDVLALAPIEDALSLAAELACHYSRAFETHLNRPATISAGLVIADHHEPLRAVIEEAHRVLESVAKEGNDRASLAVSVLKPSGRAVEWVTKWSTGAASLVSDLARAMGSNPQFSNKFIYNLRARYRVPFDGRLIELGLTENELSNVFHYELGKQRDRPEADGGDVVPSLWSVTRPRVPKGTQPPTAADFDESGLLLVRFLKQYAVWGPA